MLNKILYIIFFIFIFVSGTIFFSIKKEWIIFNFPSYKASFLEKNKLTINKVAKKNINLYYWQNNKWNKENTDILWSNNNIDNINKIVTNWLNLITEEKIVDKKVNLQNILLSQDNNIYISFDNNLLLKESSTHKKLMVIESLLKTLRENNIENIKIYFLVNHIQMQDDHLDFSLPWPLTGFIG